jgi:two-component sensor histidine kinase
MVDLQILSHADSVPTAEVHRLGQYTRSLASLHDLMTLDLRAHGPGEAISLSRAVSRIVTLLQPLAGDRRVSVRSDEAWLTLKQGSALALLLNELLMNAIRHGEGAISVVATTHEGEIRIEVLDHGPGFPAGFDGSSASGTGLLLVETAVRWDLRGRIAYENRPSGGARVELRFPVEA